MKLSSPIRIAYKNLMAAKFRSFLTILGIIIGVASVIIVMAIGQSAQQLIIDQVEGIGSNLIGVLPGAASDKGPPASVFGIVTTTLKLDDMEAILEKRNVPNAVAASGYVTGSAPARYAGQSPITSYQGVSASFPDIEKVKIGKGRFFTSAEDAGLARVAVLGASRATDLFGSQDPLGKVFTLKDTNFTVIGVLDKRGSSGFSNTDELVYVPLQTAQKIMLGIDYLNFIRIQVDAAENVDRAAADVKLTLRERHHIADPADDDFSVRSMAQALSTITNITDILKYFLAGIAAISLLVGGIGIMNIMLISVQQRIREIGLRKAVGARRRHIIVQFLVESVFITLLGGIAGIILGIALAFLAAIVIDSLGYDWKFLITFSSIAVATSVSVLIGIVFGLYPARKAARISPMEALRYE